MQIGLEKWRIVDGPENVFKPFQGRDDFPIAVELIWSPAKDACIGDEIRVKAMREIHTR